MDNLTAIIFAALRGFGDSLKGTVAIFYLDKNIKERAIPSPNKDLNTPSRRKELHREISRSSVREETKSSEEDFTMLCTKWWSILVQPVCL